MITLPNWLLISGSGKNIGKTTLICNIISEFSGLKPVAIKISSHQHHIREDSDWIIRKEDFSVLRENHVNLKDSSKMLQSGAESAFYAQGPDYRLPDILAVLQNFTRNRPVICESGGLRNVIVPGIYLLIKDEDNQVKPGIESFEILADKVLAAKDAREGKFEKNLLYKKHTWLIKT